LIPRGAVHLRSCGGGPASVAAPSSKNDGGSAPRVGHRADATRHDKPSEACCTRELTNRPTNVVGPTASVCAM
jgi:hypothetical protein